MKRPIHDLVDELDRLFYGKSFEQSSTQAGGVQCSDDSAMSLALRARRRKRRSALDEYKPVAQAFVIRRARAARPARFTYLRLQKLIERKSRRLFCISAIQRRMVHWGLADGMKRYEK
jgi:hypothetical protein